MALTQISTAGVKDDAVTAGKIPADAIGSSEIAANAVGSSEIAANAVGSSELADNAVDTDAIQDDAVTEDKLANSINTAIAANTAKTSNATHTGDVTGSTSLTIANNAVTTSKIANDAVNSDKIADNSILAGNIAENAIGASELGSVSVFTAAIQDQAVTLDKLPHGTSSNDGKFLRANNGADPTFESLPSSGLSNIVEDTSPQLGGNLDTNTHNILLNDSNGSSTNRIVLGTASDMQIFHDGSHSIIKDTGQGNLTLQSNEIVMESADGGETMAKFIDDGAVELRHNNTTRFETTSDGDYFHGTLTGGSSARSNAGITQANVHTPSARIYTGGYANGDQSVNIQGTTGNWGAGLSSTAHRSSGLLFCRTLSNTQHIRAGIQHDMHGTEKFKFHTSYGDIHFRTRNGNNGNQAWEECDRDPLIMHHNGHVSMMHMPRILLSPGGDNASYSNDLTLHDVTGTAVTHAGMTYSSGTITVPYQGVYQINANVGLHTNSNNTQRMNMLINGANWQNTEQANFSGWHTHHIHEVIELAANNTIKFQVAGRWDSSIYSRINVCMMHGTLTT